MKKTIILLSFILIFAVLVAGCSASIIGNQPNDDAPASDGSEENLRDDDRSDSEDASDKAADETYGDETGKSEADSNETGSNETSSNETGSNETNSNETSNNEADNNETGSDEADGNETVNNDTGSGETGMNPEELRTDSGKYLGRVDSNFIEIKISGVPDELSARVYMLSEEIKEGFEKYDLQQDDNIKYEYYENESGQLVIVSIAKI